MVGEKVTEEEKKVDMVERKEPLEEKEEEKGTDYWKGILKEKLPLAELQRNDQCNAMLFKGIPASLRARVWNLFAHGDIEKQRIRDLGVEPSAYYQSLVAQTEVSPAMTDIFKDLHRTLPAHDYFKTSAGQDALREVLTVFSRHNTDIGYCQGINFLCGALLLVMQDKEEAFWLLCRLIEPRKSCYSATMCGTLVDCRVFSDLVAFHEPLLAAHIEELGSFLASMVSSWVLCLFMEAPLPFDVCIRFWDIYLFHGDIMIFRLGLSLLRLNKEVLLAAQTCERLLELFMHELGSQVPFQTVLLDMQAERERQPEARQFEAHVYDLRVFHRREVLAENSVLGSGVCKRLSKKTKLPQEKITDLWRIFLKPSPWDILVAGSLSTLHSFHYAYCEAVFASSSSSCRMISEKAGWKTRSIGLLTGVFDRLFFLFDRRGCGRLDFEDFLFAVAMLTCSSRSERLKFCFRFCARDGENVVDLKGLKQATSMFDYMHNGMRRSTVETDLFCEMVFEKVGKSDMEYEDFCKAAILHPLLVSFFALDELDL